MNVVVSGLGRSAELARKIAEHGGFRVLPAEEEQFPDGECYVRFRGKLEGADVYLVNSLYPPNDEVMAALIAADAARSLGAGRVYLIAPYLAYMRQDKRFNPGEAISSRTIAGLISERFDALITVDPHLHRYKSLGEIYTISTRVLHADEAIAQWVNEKLEQPVLVGPDVESRQWVERVAKICGAPFSVMRKKRFSSTRVESTGLEREHVKGRDVVVLDDMISSGHTMAGVIETARGLGAKTVNAVVVHGLFARGARSLLRRAGAARVVTCNTVPNSSAKIDVTPWIADAIKENAA